MATAAKKKNDDDLSAAVEASGAVQTLHEARLRRSSYRDFGAR
jgi:hypothetical protein